MLKKNRSGFTLMELLVTIAIIAVLAAVSVVGYVVYLDQAKQSNANSTLTQIKTLFTLEDLSNTEFEITENGMVFSYTETVSEETTLSKFENAFEKLETGIDITSADSKNKLYIEIDTTDLNVVTAVIYCYDGASSKWDCCISGSVEEFSGSFDSSKYQEVKQADTDS